MKNKFFGLILVLFLFFSLNVFAVTSVEQVNDFNIYRAFPGKAVFGEEIWMLLLIENNSSATQSIKLTELLIDCDFNKDSAVSIDFNHGTEWNYFWDLTVPANESVTLTYWFKPKSIGSFIVPSMKTEIDSKIIYLESQLIEIECNNDLKCDLSAGENYLNCLDCSTGLNDGICDFESDGKCDSDCETGIDADCIELNEPETIAPQNEEIIAVDSVPQNNELIIAIGLFAVLLILIIAVFAFKKLKEKFK
ncbi:MAG: hypothetical protein JW703_03800 [Candidatus Diapherotrites archaeon]|nr:hypothetical protein [Candidatus Diapherotrites archaeon]